MNASEPRQFTGRHMLAIMIIFFGIIITVNFTMAYMAHRSWTGFVVKNSYVASQQFNEKMAETRAQAALHWSSLLTVKDGIVGYKLLDSSSKDVALKSVTMKFMRPVDDREDRSELLVRRDGGSFITEMPIANGAWLIEIDADAGLDKPYRETLRIHVVNGDRQ